MFGGSLVLRGFKVRENESIASRNQCLANYINRSPVSNSMLYSSFLVPLPITLTSPDYWNNSLVGPSGELPVYHASLRKQQQSKPFQGVAPNSIPVMSYLESSTSSGGDILKAHKIIQECTKKCKDKFVRQYLVGFQHDDIEIMESQLARTKAVYSQGLQADCSTN